MNKSPLLQVQDFDWHFGGNPVLEHLDREVGSGEFRVVRGPSGAGKTTLLRAISGILPLEQQKIFWRGKDLGAWSARERRKFRAELGILVQDEILFEGVRVGEYLAVGFEMQGLGREIAAVSVKKILAEREIGELRDRMLETLSRSEKKLVQFLRVVLQNPGILILDEPTMGLDVELTRKILDWLVTKNLQLKKTVVLATVDGHLADFLGEQGAKILDLG